MDFGGAKAELEDGLIYMMAGGTEQHARIAANVLIALGPRLRGSGCRPYGSDLAVRTGERTVRFPDIRVHCKEPSDHSREREQLLGDPRVVFEILSPSTATKDQKEKLEEYKSLPGTVEVILVDPDSERIRHVHRTSDGVWHDGWLRAGSDLRLPSLDIVIPHDEIFARD